MTKTKIMLIIASILVAVGLISFSVVMTVIGWDFTRLSTVEYEYKTYEISDGFSNITINSETADVEFLPSQNDKAKIVIYEEENINHLVKVENGELKIEYVNNKKWYEYIGINFASQKISLYLPKKTYNQLSVNASTSDVYINGFDFSSITISLSTGEIEISNSTVLEEVKLSVSTGDTELENLNCKNLTSIGSTGDIELNNVIVEQKISIERSTGDVEFTGIDAREIIIKTSTGDVEGSVLTEKIFYADSSTGKINVPKTVNGGRFEVETSTGDIKIVIK